MAEWQVGRVSGSGRSAYQLYLADARKLGRGIPDTRTLVESHLFYVVQVAKEYRNLGIPIEDLLSEGNLGLLEAAQRFDRSRGVKFISYATWWIRKRICDLVARQISLVRLPKYRLARLRKLRMVEADLRAELGRQPNVEEISRSAHLSRAEVDALHGQAQREVSLDSLVNVDSGLRLEEVLAETSTRSPDSDLIRENCEDLLGKLLERLPSRQREVISMHFGLAGKAPTTLAEIGRHIGVSRERVRQLERQGLARLRYLMSPEQRQQTA
jgi:RNA polymerase sigma factor (sigma-70 family)